MEKNIINEYEEITADLLETFSLFTNEQFNAVPFEGSWTAGQIAEHLFKSESNAVSTLNGNTTPTDSRVPDANVETIRAIFLDYNVKFKSPDFIIPSDTPKDNETFLKEFKKTRSDIKKIIENEDLTLTCKDFSLPGLGELTRHEWICFVNCHTMRHVRQMKNIYKILTE